jgi:malonate decarboxylase alpha subunit
MLDPLPHEPDRPSRLARAAALCGATGKLCPAERATQLLEAIIEPGDRVAIEGDNQKQADFLASALANVDPARIHDLHMMQSVLALPEHLAVFECGRRHTSALAPRSETLPTQPYDEGRESS